MNSQTLPFQQEPSGSIQAKYLKTPRLGCVSPEPIPSSHVRAHGAEPGCETRTRQKKIHQPSSHPTDMSPKCCLCSLSRESVWGCRLFRRSER
ncbi:hypothetical protein K504DRAFT_292115 [Pleomassaria siparia CBS 279.74]|uniref:Uncharacterized protein n=1 Tax=Pleomassaria siparia CBS 279.74 TaxID=1314801 RepID=A0A6G1K8T2_9PLEO|nr:hypothetical protein K504DRAFT_292115 [Pleomassaria siparia CBS 279.74]